MVDLVKSGFFKFFVHVLRSIFLSGRVYAWYVFFRQWSCAGIF